MDNSHVEALRNRPTTPLDAIPELPRDLTVFNLDEVLFGKNVRLGLKGAAGGPSGMTHDHLRPLLESPKDLHLLYTVCNLFAKGQMPGEVVQTIKLGRMTALQKEGGGVRGIVAGEVIRSDSQDDRPAVGPSGEGRHSSVPMCTVDKIRMRVYCTCTSSCDGTGSRGHNHH